MPSPSPSYTLFQGNRFLASGPLASMALEAKRATERPKQPSVLIFDDLTGKTVDVDFRGTDEAIVARLTQQVPEDPTGPRGRGRPKLGVIPREVTLLPRHWDWLALQPGGASVALRKLIDEARRTHGQRDQLRARQERVYHFISTVAGDLPGFEEAARALFANDQAKLDEMIASWPADIRKHVDRLRSLTPPVG